MEDQKETTPAEGNEAEVQATEASTEETGASEATEEVTEAEKSEEPASEEDESGDADYWKSEAKKARSEAAARRVANRDLEAKLKEAKSPEDIAAIVADHSKQLLEKDKEIVATKFSLPEELAEVLKGETREELEAHAKKLAKFAPADVESDDEKETGGLNARSFGNDSGTTDPIQLRNLMVRGKKTYII